MQFFPAPVSSPPQAQTSLWDVFNKFKFFSHGFSLIFINATLQYPVYGSSTSSANKQTMLYSPWTTVLIDAVDYVTDVLYSDVRKIFLLGARCIAVRRNSHQLHVVLVSVTGQQQAATISCKRHLGCCRHTAVAERSNNNSM
jgi:hypothetical protein